jgi:hypothetical protein
MTGQIIGEDLAADGRHGLAHVEDRGEQQKSKNCSHGLPEPQRIALDHRSPRGLARCRVQCIVLKGEDPHRQNDQRALPRSFA